MSDPIFGHQPDLPDGDREVFGHLCRDLAWINAKWRLYMDLFGTQDSTDLLSCVAPGAFQLIEEAIRTDLTMSLCRLSDPSETGSMQNLSMARIAKRFDHVPGLKELREKFDRACSPMKTIRNKQVGHNDLNTALNPNDHPVPGICRGDVEAILGLAERILNTMIRSVTDTTYCFDLRVIGDGKALLHALRIAEQVNQTGRDRLGLPPRV